MIRMRDKKLSDIVAKYNENVKKLFKLGSKEFNFRINYQKRFKFTTSDIEQLLLLANDKELYNYKFTNEDDYRYFYAIVHAWNALSQMEIIKAKDIFIEILNNVKDENFDDYIVTGFRQLIAPFRSKMYNEFQRYIKDETLNEWVRIEYIETLRDMFETDELNFEDTDLLFKTILTNNKNKIINSFIISICKDYGLTQHYDDIVQCFKNNNVDLSHDGDLEDCEIAFGKRKERETKRKISNPVFDFLDSLGEIDMVEVEKEGTEEKIASTNTIIKVGRNELCPCGSGKKYKKCCLNK